MKFCEREIGGVKFLTIDSFEAAGLKHAFLGRGIDLRDLERGRETVRSLFKARELRLLEQVHSATIVHGAGKVGSRPRADAWVVSFRDTKLSGIAYGITTADCVPVIIVDLKHGFGAVVHAGWRGIVARIIEESIAQLVSLGGIATDLQVAVGPSAQSCCYCVGEDVRAVFSEMAANERWPDGEVVMKREQGLFLNLSQVVRLQSVNMGVSESQIVVSTHCTICNHDFFSYRREGARAGRQLTYVAI